MLKNYLITAIRNLKRNKIFSTINILGLALGMACSLLIMLWVQHEKSINAFHTNAKRLYIMYEQQYENGNINSGYFTPGVLAEEIKRKMPEVEASSSYAWNELSTFQVGDKIIKESGNHADGDYLTMFTHKILQGSAATALNSPTSIAISRKMADDFFGSASDAIGKTIRYDNKTDLQVTAVFENLTDKYADKYDYLINWKLFLENNSWAKDWSNNGPTTFIMLRPDADPDKVAAKVKKFLVGLNTEMTDKVYIDLGIQRFTDTYLNSNFKNGVIAGGRIEYVRLFTIIAIFILLIACINFMNLTTARSVKRSKEIGIRKVAGAFRTALIRQFMGEAILITFFALIIAIVLVALLLPAFNHVTQKQIVLPLNQPFFWISLLGLTLVTGIISGSYPALFLSNFQPIRVLKGSMKFSSGATRFRKGLVVFQFVLSIILIIGTIVVSKQINYIQTINLGYDRDNLVYVPIEGDLRLKYTLLKEEAVKIPGVKLITKITQDPTHLSNSTGGVVWEGKDMSTRPEFVQASVGYDFVKTMNLKMVDGRDFSRDLASDSVGYIVNESALKIIPYKDPIGKPLTFWQKKGTIIGVLKDFHFSSLHEPIMPIVLRLGEKDTWGTVLVRIEAGKTKQALAGLEKLCKGLNPNFPFTYSFSDEEYKKLYTSEQVVSKLSDYFAFLAIFISCLGLLGLVMFTAEQRTKEIGIRKILGASVGSLFGLLSKEFLVLVLLAFVIAAPLAFLATSNWLENFAYRTPIAWWVYLIAAVASILIALITVSFQAIKAALANPVKSLRTE